MVVRPQGFLGDWRSLHHNSHHHNRAGAELLKKGASSLELSRLRKDHSILQRGNGRSPGETKKTDLAERTRRHAQRLPPSRPLPPSSWNQLSLKIWL